MYDESDPSSKFSLPGINTRHNVSDHVGTDTWPLPTDLRPVIEFRGGSGGIAQAYVRDLTLAGASPDAGVTGVRFNSQDGVTVSGCVLLNLTVGVHFDNADAGGFTEYIQVVDSPQPKRN